MPQIWIPTLKRRLMLGALDFLVDTTRSGKNESAVLESVNRILVIEPKNIGDVVLATPFLAQLRARFPMATTTLLAAPHAKAILQGTGLVHDYIETRLDWTEKFPAIAKAAKSLPDALIDGEIVAWVVATEARNGSAEL